MLIPLTTSTGGWGRHRYDDHRIVGFPPTAMAFTRHLHLVDPMVQDGDGPPPALCCAAGAHGHLAIGSSAW